MSTTDQRLICAGERDLTGYSESPAKSETSSLPLLAPNLMAVLNLGDLAQGRARDVQ